MMKKILTFLIVVSLLATTILPIMAAETDWYQGWTVTGNVSRTGTAVNLESTARIEKAFPFVNGKFDVEFDFKSNDSTGKGIIIYLGNYRLYASFWPDRFEYFATGWATTNDNANTRKAIYCDLGTDWHTYRFKGIAPQCEVYIDGYFMGTINVMSFTSDPGILVLSAGLGCSFDNLIIHDASNVVLSESGSSDQAPAAPEAVAFEDTFDSNDGSWKVLESGNWWKIEDGVLKGSNPDNMNPQGVHIEKEIGIGDDFVITFDVRNAYYDPGIGWRWGFYILWDNKQIHPMLSYNDYYYYNATGFGEVAGGMGGKIGTDWAKIRLETINNKEKVRMYIDDILLFEGYVKTFGSKIVDIPIIRLYTTYMDIWPCDTEIEIDNFKYTPITHHIEMSSPVKGSDFLEGKPIALKSVVDDAKKNDVPYVDYKINGSVVARGYAPDYEATLTNIGPGNYAITAEYGEEETNQIDITVVSSTKGKNTNVTKNKDGSYTLKSDIYDNTGSVDRVEFVVDGVSVGSVNSAPYQVTIPALTPEPHKISVVCYSKNGLVIDTNELNWMPTLTPSSVTTSYSNRISYNVSGNQGSGEYDLKNGNHRVLLTHTPSKVTYLTASGAESFSPGTGNFEIITEGAVADVYRNGQLAFSYFLPQTTEVGQSYKQNGLTFSNKSISVPETRGVYFSKDNITESHSRYSLESLPYVYRTDFIADKDDDARIIVNDSLYRSDVELKDGKFYVWTIVMDDSEPERVELCDAVDADRVYYHFETSGGMCRLYGNGVWLATFRAIHSVGEKSVNIYINGGNGLENVSIIDNQDFYVYNDDFSGNAEFDSAEYWQCTNGMEVHLDGEYKRFMLMAKGKTDAIAELNAFAGDEALSADLSVSSDKGGVYVIAHHSHSNKYVKVGYNFEKKQYEIIDNYDGKLTVLAEKAGTFPVNQTVHIDFKVDNIGDSRYLELYVNGALAISATDDSAPRGKIGFIVTDNMVYLKSASYVGDAKPVSSLIDHPFINDATLWATVDYIEQENGILIPDANHNSVVTTDGGKTWTKAGSNPAYTSNTIQLYEKKADGSTGLSDEVIALECFQVGTAEDGKPLGNVKIYHSSDRGKTWEDWGWMFEEPAYNKVYFFTQDAIKQGYSGRLYVANEFYDPDFVGEDGGHVRVYYSDDKGKTWIPSETALKKIDLGIVLSECSVIETPDGITTIYCRTDSGMVKAIKSYDYGKTWDTSKIYSTPFITSTNCSGAQIDPTDWNTIYYAWCQDNANLSSTIQLPRQRWCLARSTDCGNTWEFLGTVYECLNDGTAYSNIMNLVVNVTSDYVFLSGYSLDADVAIHTYGRIVSLRKDKLKGVKDFEQVHLSSIRTLENASGMTLADMDGFIVINENDGTIYLNGMRVENAVQNGEILLDSIATLTGTSIETNEDGKTALTIGEAEIAIENVSSRDGKLFVDIDEMVKLFNFDSYETEDGIRYFGNVRKLTEILERNLLYGIELNN